MKSIFTLVFCFLTSLSLLAQTLPPPGVPNIIDVSVSADKWHNLTPYNAQYIDGNFVESKSLRGTNAILYFRDFRLAVPSTATIKGIDVRVTRRKKGANDMKDVTVALLKPANETQGMGKGPNLAKPDLWTEKLTTVLYAFPDTAVDASGATFWWTPADVNHPAFGLHFNTQVGTGKGAVILFDKVELTVRFTEGTKTQSVTVQRQGKDVISMASGIQLKQMGRSVQVLVAEEGKYLFTVRNSAGAVLQQTTINGGKIVTIPIDARLKGHCIITVEGRKQVKSLQAIIK